MLVLDYAHLAYNNGMKSIVVIAHDLRSAHNIGALLRTSDGLGVEKVYLSGYSPFPSGGNIDTRLPHLVAKLDRQIRKTALGAEASVDWHYVENVHQIVDQLKTEGYVVAALEQAADSKSLTDFVVPDKIALVLGREVEGIAPGLLAECDVTLEIPMLGAKESHNVVQAAAMALYHLQFGNK